MLQGKSFGGKLIGRLEEIQNESNTIHPRNACGVEPGNQGLGNLKYSGGPAVLDAEEQHRVLVTEEQPEQDTR